MTLRLYLAIILLLITTASQAEPTVILEQGVGKYDLGLHAEILEDQQGELTINQVSSPAYANQWTQSQQAKPHFSFSDSVYWLRITLNSEMQIPKTWWFELAFPLQ